MERFTNPLRGRGIPADRGLAQGEVPSDPSGVQALLARCPVAEPTPLVSARSLAAAFGVARLDLKDERLRMGLGSFKALGAAHVIARMATDRLDRSGRPATEEELATALEGEVFACASAGNHGLSVAAGAAVFGARAVVYLSDTVPEAFADRLRQRGAEVVRAGDDYEQSMAAVAVAAEQRGWVLLSDSSWPGYVDQPAGVMEGYLALASEIDDALDRTPTHVLLQAGVGGLAAAVSAFVRERWGEEVTIVVVEPAAAPALLESIRAGRPVATTGPVSSMGRLDCKEPSHLALGELARSADHLVTIDDAEADATVALLGERGITTTASGAAGVAALHHAGDHREALGFDGASRVLAIITEGATDAG